MSAMLHEQSGGRFALGVGAGWASTEFAALGLDPARRGELTDAYLRIIIDAWTHETVSADGVGVRFQHVATGPQPAGGRVPLWVGGNGLAAIRRAAGFGDAWHPINPRLSWLRDIGIPALEDAAAVAQRPVPDVVVRIKARVEPPPRSGPRPLGVGSLPQIVEDVSAIFAAGAAEVVLDPNPDVSTPRNAIIEQRHLVEIKEAYQRAQ
jgi:hypothetical protein